MSDPPLVKVRVSLEEPLQALCLADALTLALQAHQGGKLSEAAGVYRAILEAQPEYFDALHLLGVVHHQQGDDARALSLIRRAIALDPDNADAHSNLGSVHKTLGEFEAAISVLERAIALDPTLASAYNNLGGARQERGSLDEAVEAYRQAIRIAPDFAEAHANLASALLSMGLLDEAASSAGSAVSLAPDDPRALSAKANVLEAQGELAAAALALRKAIADDSADAKLHYSLGVVLDKQKKWDEALAAYGHALQLDPGSGAALSASLHLKRALMDWQGMNALYDRFVGLVESGARDLSPFAFLAEESSPRQQLVCARLWAKGKEKAVSPLRARLSFDPRPARGDKITLGYVSADFYRHPTAYLSASLFEEHDRSRFVTIAYSNGPDDGSAMRRRLSGAFDEFVDVRGMTHGRIAERIFRDGVEILIDLKGYTLDALTEVFALRPAPIQVNYLGYPGTMGASFMDYIVADRIVIPDESRETYSESIVYLPHSYQVNDARREAAAATPSRSECGLPAAGFVFCCFNSSWKLTGEILDLWSRILNKVPGSVLWLLDSYPSRALRQNLSTETRQRGLDPARVVLSPKLPLAEYLARFRHADLFLDTLPYNAHTTASDALWMGCPVLTCPGTTFASRVGASLLRAVGMPDLIAGSLQEYQDRAVALARHPGECAALKERLLRGRSSCALFDTPRFARHLEAAYERMHKACLDGQKPRIINIEET